MWTASDINWCDVSETSDDGRGGECDDDHHDGTLQQPRVQVRVSEFLCESQSAQIREARKSEKPSEGGLTETLALYNRHPS